MAESGILWTDKKRYLGLAISFTEYSLTDQRLMVKSGLFTVRYNQTMLFRVQDIEVTTTLGQRFFGVGNIKIISNDKNSPDMLVENVRNPLGVKELIHSLVEDIREKKNMQAGEVLS